MSIKDDEKQNTQSAKVLQLGFNISVTGDPGTDFQIVLDDTGQKATAQNETYLHSLGILPKKHSKIETSNSELEVDTKEVESIDSKLIKLKSSKDTSPKIGEQSETSSSKESNIINEIKNTLEHFEKFSDHLKDVPRLKGYPAATSTPLSDKNNSKSESNLLYPEFKPRKFPHLYDYHYKKNYYFNKPAKPPDLFLKPLPGENLYRSGFYTRYATDSLRHYVSDSSLNKTSDYKVVCEKLKCDDLTLDTPGILKKPDSESGDKQSTSSAESIKDIKIYQSGGILIMQNFKDNMDEFEKKEISNFSAKLIENCGRLKEGNSFQEGNIKGMGFFPEEGRSSGKMVQFDLSGFENAKSKSRDFSLSPSKDEKLSLKQGSSDSISDSTKNKESSPQGTSQSQDFPSLSTVENESTISNQFGVSPTYSSTKKLEWDSGADVGYYNSDLSKENLSTVEKYVLSHLSSGTYTDNRPDFSKFSQVRIASDRLMNEIREERRKEQQEIMVIEKKDSCEHEVEVVELSDDEPVNDVKVGNSKESGRLKAEKLKPNEVLRQEEPKSKPKAVELTDKSVNVNTLFKNVELNPSHRTITSEDYRKVDIANKKSSKVRKFRKSKPSPRKITWAPQKKRFSLENLNSDYESPVFEVGMPKRTYKKVDLNPKIGDLELSREIEEIVIDQRFKIKQNVSSGKEIKKPNVGADEKENKSKRPVSGSSSSNNTVLPNIENKEAEKNETVDVNKFSDQIIQTIGLNCESVGVQAFESQKSSDCSSRIGEQPKAPNEAVNVHLSSKNIQAFGLNASLPKELAHPKETSFPEKQHAKSTQFFGGPINSLPNYHSSHIIKSKESCDRVPKILNTKKTVEAEVIRLNEENKRNILANDSQKTNSKSRRAENKENLFSENSKRSHSSASQKTKSGSSSEKKDMQGSDLRSEKHLSLMEDLDNVHTSDEVSSKVLTSEVLKEHGDSIDRNIIQEKYFQSQLIELKKREMVSRSTSVDAQIEGGGYEKECVTVGCQYSSHSKDTASEEESKDQVLEDDFIEKSKQKSQRTETTDQYDSSPNIVEEELMCTSKSTNQGQITGDSLPGSSQTAHSWIPGVQYAEKDKSGVGKARSFEYLPGHIYESSGNLREELPRETEQNLVTSSSSESDSGKLSSNTGGKDSEGRQTLILENSSDNSHESNQLKILDENLTQLNLIVSKLWEKEVEVKKLNQSLFLNLWHKSGSGDHIGHSDTLETEVIQRKNIVEHGKESGDSTYELSAHVEKIIKEISIGCQTEEKSSTDPEKFYEKRETLEKRISEEKKNQIRWIENEIHHLNKLRELLEKQSFSHQRKKRHSLESQTQSGTSKIEIDRSNSNLNDNFSGPVTPVYGCTISLARNSPPAENRPMSERSNSQSQQEHINAVSSDPVQYGMSVCLRNVTMNALQNCQGLVTLPVGVQISLKGSGVGGERSNSEGESENIAKTNLKSRPVSSPVNSLPRENMTCGHYKIPQNEVCTQFPSSRKDCLNFPSTSVQTDFTSRKCSQCQRQNCFCLDLSFRSLQSTSHSSKASERRESLRCSFGNEEVVVGNKTSNSTDPELLKLENGPNSKSDKPAKVLIDSDDKSGYSGKFPKLRCIHKKECKKHLERGHSSPVKSSVQGIVCQNSCMSSATPVSDKSDDSCRCSKVQIQKFSTCSCHIIKIMGTKCSAESGSCRCKKRTLKTTENQSCQTDQVTIVTKDLMETAELIKASKAQGMDNLSGEKITIEKETSVLQKLPDDQRIPTDKRPSCDKKLEVQERGFVKRSSEIDNFVKEKNLQTVCLNCMRRGAEEEKMEIEEKFGKFPQNNLVSTKALRADQNCTCFEEFHKNIATGGDHIEPLGKEKAEKNDCVKALREAPSEDDNHPRHYFLKIEETEIDDSKESLEMKNSLKVITVKVPVKKAGKAKIYNPKCSRSYQTDRYSVNSRKEIPKRCNCCQGCRGYNQQSVEYNASNECRIQAEKPQSPIRFSDPYQAPVMSLDDTGYRYNYDKYQPHEKNCSSIRAECYCDRSTNSEDSESKRDIQIEYDNHKKYGCQVKCKSNADSNFYEIERNQGSQEKVQRRQRYDVDEILVNDQKWPCKPQNGCSCSNEDYYNYDRTEYKTKSELLKEEEKKRKTHQPSLQEYLCRNRPDFYNTAERRRQIITKKAKERIIKHDNRMECLMNLIHCCNDSVGEKRIFTTSEMRGQTLKRYKKLPEVTGKIADQKKKEEYRTNKLVADIYSKKLQIETLKGCGSDVQN